MEWPFKYITPSDINEFQKDKNGDTYFMSSSLVPYQIVLKPSIIPVVEPDKPIPEKSKAVNNAYQLKYWAKHRAKKKIKTKFKIGRYYFQRIKPKDGSPNVVIKYQCVKPIYSIKDIETNIVIMRQISPYDGRKFTLDRQECAKFHIKFEPGLEVWPMEINWIPEKKIENN